MSLATRIEATDAVAYTLAGSAYLGDLIKCTFTITNATEDTKGAADRWEYNDVTSSGYTMDATLFASSAGSVAIDYALLANPKIAVVFSTGGGTLSATVTVTSCALQYERSAFQKYDLQGNGYGAITKT